MKQTYNIYCDESCHLENDGQSAMVLGAVCCPLERVREISTHLRDVKERHGLARNFEVKWTKVSPAKLALAFYREWMEYFFNTKVLHFRALIVPDKRQLNHAAFPNQDHDVWYYKMYFDMLKVILSPNAKYRIYIDIKDTCGAVKQKKLHEVLCNNQLDFQREIIERVQQIRSHESEILQLADLLIGAVSYINRGLAGNAGKESLVAYMRHRSSYSLTQTTLLRENKVNLLRWRAKEVQE
ncbi:MAG TPA: DUF3800 domain-containing protein [Phycisphaerae bacterium]|nr:DUF3800 domain-containing protein [Phycisphaerae bacterium]